MLKSKNLIYILFTLCFFSSKAQNNTRGVLVSLRLEFKNHSKPLYGRIDTFFVRNDFILEPITVNYSHDEVNLKTNERTNATSDRILKWYTITNTQSMAGMSFEVEKKGSTSKIEVHKAFDGNKRGMTFVNEPFLSNGFAIADYAKEKDTIINGVKCFLMKNTRILSAVNNGRGSQKVMEFRIAINPLLKPWAFNFISEKIPHYFGGGSIVYVDYTTKEGFRTTMYYNYTELNSAERDLFDYYQGLYNFNIALLNK